LSVRGTRPHDCATLKRRPNVATRLAC
jgi:hypothetical protein